MIIKLIGVTGLMIGLVGFAGQAKADCWDYYSLGNEFIDGMTYVRACQVHQLELVRQGAPLQPSRTTPSRTIAILYRLDGNANVRSSANGESGVMLNTTQSSTVTVHSWDGDWAWITTANGVNGWTHRVNLTKIND